MTASKNCVLQNVGDSLAVLRRGIDCIGKETLIIAAVYEINPESCLFMLEQYAFCFIIRKLVNRQDGETSFLLSLKEIHETKLASFDAVGNPRYSLFMLYIGPHVSISSSIALAPERAHALGATGFGLFTKNQRVWSAPPLEEAAASAFRKAMKDLGYSSRSALPHASYLINPATPEQDKRNRALSLFKDECDRTLRLGLEVINIHPGSYKEGEKEDGLKRTASFLDEALESYPGLRIAIENTAGGGTIIGTTFEELDMIISSARERDRIGITIDTAHLFGSGYNVKDDAVSIMDSFIARFGKEKLYGMHLNDSKVALGSHRDRHESIGKGLIGAEPFLALVKMDALQDIPLVLETPDENAWKDEINMLLEA